MTNFELWEDNCKKSGTIADESFMDTIGGVHDEGLGWNPNGVFCGECSNSTCEKCPCRFETEQVYPTYEMYSGQE